MNTLSRLSRVMKKLTNCVFSDEFINTNIGKNTNKQKDFRK